ncbi:MAG: hypothetical protein F2839_01845 [Actinobacteria bacterium]|uniref:Unannotated protein n=1 Tax=freshwater metagenome TaxID=449393 RepID=A0A6J5YVU4_9ZZZZ|nr:hypothetical protein [Actinomycetota bacterium]
MDSETPGSQENLKIGKLLESIATDAKALVRGHIELAKAELQQSAKSATVSLVAFVMALAMLNLGIILLFVAGAFAINAAGLSLWASFLIVGGGLFLLGGFFALFGINRMKKAASPGKSVAALNTTMTSVRGLIKPRKD